jgi:hypothetical protein
MDLFSHERHEKAAMVGWPRPSQVISSTGAESIWVLSLKRSSEFTNDVDFDGQPG